MTEELYLPDREYRKEFDSKVSRVREQEGYVVLEKTLFYPEGGGQPADRGTLSWNGTSTKVVDVQKKGGEVRHFVDGEFPEEGEEVHGEIDWERRFKHMRMHTAQHLLSWIVLKRYGASTAGNQIHKKYSRIDFKPVEFTQEDVEKIQRQANAMIQEDLQLEKRYMDREEVEEAVEEGRTNLEIIPDSIDPLRVVVIGGEDICPCGGTHVDSLKEIGRIQIRDRRSKGSDVERLEFELEEV